MHGIYNYMPETNRVFIVRSVAAVLYLQSVLRVMLFGMLNSSVPLHQHFPQSVCSAQYGWFM